MLRAYLVTWSQIYIMLQSTLPINNFQAKDDGEFSSIDKFVDPCSALINVYDSIIPYG